MEPWLEQVIKLGSNVTIVGLFLWYLIRRDREITKISDRCHKTQEAGHIAIKELTVSIRAMNGRKK